MLKLLSQVRDRSLAVLARLAFFPPLLARLLLGWVFLKSGWGKLHNLPQVIQFFTDLGVPAPQIQAPFVAGTELVCGAALLLGLLSRLAAVPLMATMVVALWTAKRADIASLNDLFGTTEFLYIALLLWVAIAGPGAVSLDARFGKRQEEAHRGADAS